MIRQTLRDKTKSKTTNEIFRRSIRLLPALARQGVAPIDALAIAFNATYLFYNMKLPHVFAPSQVLKRYSFAQIAGLCENILGTHDFSINENFKEVLP